MSQRTELTFAQKSKIIASCDGPPKRTFAIIAKMFNINASTVSKIYSNKNAYLKKKKTVDQS